MAGSSTAVYAATPNPGAPGLLTTADVSWTSPSTVATIFTAGANGSRVDFLDAVGVATTTACMVNFFRYDGATCHLLTSQVFTGVTASTTASPEQYHLSAYNNPSIFPVILKNGDTIRAAVTVTQTGIKVHARGGDF